MASSALKCILYQNRSQALHYANCVCAAFSTLRYFIMGWHTCSLYVLACIPKNTSLRCILILCTPEPLGEVEGTKELTPPPPLVSNELFCPHKIQPEWECSVDTPWGARDYIAKRR